MNIDDRLTAKHGPIGFGRAWRGLLTRLGSFYLWALVWLAALTVPFIAWPGVLVLALACCFSALLLAPGRHHGNRLLALAAVFFIFWALVMVLIRLFSPETSLRPVLNLAAWLSLGLNLMLAKTPLEISLPLGRALVPVLGRLKAQKLALSLALLARLIPGLLAAAVDLKRTCDRRARGLSFSRRLILWGRAMARTALSQTDDLARTLLKRWPW